MNYSYTWEAIFNPGKADDFFQSNKARLFEVSAADYNRDKGWLLSELSRLIYLKGNSEEDPGSQTTRRNTYLSRVGLMERWFYNGKYIQCAIVSTRPEYGQNFSVLVFRGTQGGLASWLFNLSTILSPWPSGGQVHKGFKLMLLEAWKDIEQQLRNISGPLYYTGHSLGGALAVLSASLKKPDAVYTFGAPRIGNLDFVKSTQHIKIYRIVNSRDIVTAVPPIPGMFHAGEPHCLTGPKDDATQRSWFEAPGFLADHSPANYTVLL